VKFRVGVAGFLHESNTFLGVPTGYENFVAASLTRGPDVVARWRGAHHELGGFVDGLLAAEDVELVPLLATFAIPSGTVTAEAFERVVGELVLELRTAMPLDGLLLALHGATVSAAFPDADGEVLKRVREVLGEALPVVTTLDLHANVSQAMVERATATMAYRTNPHLDQRERGLEAADLLLRTLRGEVRPVQHLESPPMLIQISKQHTAGGAARELYELAAEVMDWPGVLSASITMGFYYADVAEMGAAAIVVADGDAGLAAKAARYLAVGMWARRERLTGELPAPAEAVAAAMAAERGPVVLMDVGDNVGAGSPADSTVLLGELLRQGGRDGLVILFDPAAVAACAAAGVGAGVELEVGQPPVRIVGLVRTLSDGKFVERQVRHGGWGACDQGLTAVVEMEAGHSIVLTSRRMAPMSLEQVLSLGLNPAEKQVLIVKGVVAPRAAYEPIAAKVVLVDTPGVTSDNPAHFEYRERRRPLFPLEREATYE
jgi:microcystin degradation protein MlrC